MTKDRLAALQAVSVAHYHHHLHHYTVNLVFESKRLLNFITCEKSDDDDDDLIDIMRKKYSRV